MRKQFLFYFFGCFLFFISCKKEQKKQTEEPIKTSTIKYAKGFDIIRENSDATLVINNPYPNSKKKYYFNIRQKKPLKEGKVLHDILFNEIYTPINKMIVTSTTHIPMIELLEEEKSLIGFPNSKYVSSEKTRALIDNGQIKEVGNEASLNTEIVLDLKPEVIVAFSMSETNKTLDFLQKNGIPVLLNGDWLEETPLGRAEWIKFFGLLYGKSKEADSIFSVIEKNYLEAKSIAANSKIKPTVLSGAIMSKDVWNLPAGESFVAQFLKDANTNYLWQETSGKGSLSLSFESVFVKGKNADYWISPGYFSSKEEMINNNSLYGEFSAFKENLFSPNLKKGATGGVIYFELAPTRPDLVLKDIIKITHPKLLPDYSLTFFDKMK